MNQSNFMKIQDSLKALEKFNRKAIELEASGFSKDKTKSRAKLSFRKGEYLKSERFGPNKDYIKSASITIRFFIRDNEGCSFRVLGKIYENLPILEDKKTSFRNARKKLNEFLDRKSNYNINNINPTNREILEAFIYGDISHENPNKRKLYDIMMSGILGPIMENEFVYILSVLFSAISFVKTLNEEIIKELEKMKSKRI